MSQKDKKYFYLYSAFLVLFLLITNEFYTYHETLIINQYDGRSYFKISEFSFSYADDIPFHHAQRFFLPFIIGILGDFFDIDNFMLFRSLSIFFILIIIFIHINLLIKLKINFKDAIISTTLIFLNPYLFRYFISVPTMINDLFFVLGLYLFLYAILIDNKFLLLSLTVSLMSRQTGLFVFIALLYLCYYKKLYKTSFLSLIIFCIILFLSNHYASKSSVSGFNFEHLMGFFKSINSGKQIFETIKWMALPIYSFLPVIIFLFSRKFIKAKLFQTDSLIIFFIFSSTIGISYLAGPDLAGRNILRQTSIVLPLLMFLIITKSKNKYKMNNLNLIEKIFIFLIFLSSFHPIYSKFQFLNQIKII